ncbi:MAG: porin family protein [Saprospiraceae bacterium]|nr:PorT family protein [Saprospiraceae bacterium]MDW8230564.1 porin family protein [Saprospiraceae bacterium]
MKKVSKIALLLLLLLSATGLSAQGVGLGLRGGLHFANWSLNDVAKDEFVFDPKSATGLLFGALLEIRLSNNLAIQPEVTYIQKGTKIDETILSVKSEGGYTINYLEVPIMLKVGTGFGVGRFDVLLGPSFGYGLNGKYEIKATSGGITVTEEEDIDFEKDEISRTDLGAQFGASVGLNLGSSARLFVDGRYLLGFTNLDKHEHGSGEEPTVRNRGVALTAGLMFSF